ncbi:MAG TPA: hypothetical protein VFM80_00230 [Gracilimonas sp.]|uniref:hypothetical protein n=1 Tax=Gracilimonas sp. TaxID=1974203 RepID=UPI002D9D2E0A|nr:hypothetical protein [Gracilimonas sp.]
MKILTAIFNFYLQSSIHVSLAVTSLAVISVMQIGFVPEPLVLIFIFLGTIVGYNFVKYAGVSNRHNLKITLNVNLIRGFTGLCFLGLIYFGRLLPIDVLITAAMFGFLTLLYAVPLYKNRNLRSLSGIKIFIIALVWMGVSVLVPLTYHNLSFNLRVFYQCLEIFLFVIVLTLPFEIRDLKYDENKLGTIPQKLGVKRSKWLGTVLLMLAAVVAFLQNYRSDLGLFITLGIFLLTLILLWAAKKDQGKYYAAFLVESVPIVWLILLLNF